MRRAALVQKASKFLLEGMTIEKAGQGVVAPQEFQLAECATILGERPPQRHDAQCGACAEKREQYQEDGCPATWGRRFGIGVGLQPASIDTVELAACADPVESLVDLRQQRVVARAHRQGIFDRQNGRTGNGQGIDTALTQHQAAAMLGKQRGIVLTRGQQQQAFGIGVHQHQFDRQPAFDKELVAVGIPLHDQRLPGERFQAFYSGTPWRQKDAVVDDDVGSGKLHLPSALGRMEHAKHIDVATLYCASSRSPGADVETHREAHLRSDGAQQIDVESFRLAARSQGFKGLVAVLSTSHDGSFDRGVSASSQDPSCNHECNRLEHHASPGLSRPA